MCLTDILWTQRTNLLHDAVLLSSRNFKLMACRFSVQPIIKHLLSAQFFRIWNSLFAFCYNSLCIWWHCTKTNFCNFVRVSLQGVESLWGDCRFIPADQGSYWVIYAICSFWRLFTIIMIKGVKVFQFSFWKIMIFFTS